MGRIRELIARKCFLAIMNGFHGAAVHGVYLKCKLLHCCIGTLFNFQTYSSFSPTSFAFGWKNNQIFILEEMVHPFFLLIPWSLLTDCVRMDSLIELPDKSSCVCWVVVMGVWFFLFKAFFLRGPWFLVRNIYHPDTLHAQT